MVYFFCIERNNLWNVSFNKVSKSEDKRNAEESWKDQTYCGRVYGTDRCNTDSCCRVYGGFKFHFQIIFAEVTGMAVVIGAILPTSPGNLTFIINMLLLVLDLSSLEKGFGVKPFM